MAVKRFITASILISLSAFCLAQEETQAVSAAEAPLATPIGERYIRDYIYVPLRSGQSSSHRIVHKGLKSGVIVSLLEDDAENKYSLVRTSKGIEGWIPTQYLVAEPTAAIKLREANQTIQQLTKNAGPLSEKLVTAEKQAQSLTRDLERLQRDHKGLQNELKRIKGLSSGAINLDENNKTLLKDLELIKNETDTLKAENSRLQTELTNNDFWFGVLAVILGMIATLTIQNFAKSKRSSEWA
jgi:SH3 domain protein